MTKYIVEFDTSCGPDDYEANRCYDVMFNGRVTASYCTPENANLIALRLNEYDNLMRVVVAAHNLLDHRAENYLNNTVYPYAPLRAALDHLAKGV